ncbi:hypothetical protein BJ875DRAFT_528176 [Amylocarpus encephaloides]|uniref:DUF7924 domain-containing protein n=1 Tax=Amylocarpus encephaloides TaxID=45428 RepID=A0A9P7Y7Q2_9HELO|nr:hypothetical protein BJ875DRAFT_528176 [Amylocarpus encephaloides]
MRRRDTTRSRSNRIQRQKYQTNLPKNRSTTLPDMDRNGKRARGPEEPPVCAPMNRPQKRLHASIAGANVKHTCDSNDKNLSLIDYWRKTGSWPKQYFEQDDQTRKDLNKDQEKDGCYEKYWKPEKNMNHLLTRKKSSSSSSLRIKQSEAGSAAPSSTTPGDQNPREVKSAPYQDAPYETILATKGSFMGKSRLGITDGSKTLCQTLLEKEQTVPQGSLFLESVNEGWNNSIPITKTHPQPDYATGFGREALQIVLSFFMATYYMYFPFLTCEVNCGATALDIADLQNAHIATMAVRGVVELFRQVKREQELHREILAFSISHDHRTVRIYGRYPIIEGDKTTFYRHPIHTFDFTVLDGREKWTAYKFTKNIYDMWMPNHFKMICSVIDKLPPDIDFEASQESELGECELSLAMKCHRLSDQSSQ